jgi:hypothetical protein
MREHLPLALIGFGVGVIGVGLPSCQGRVREMRRRIGRVPLGISRSMMVGLAVATDTPFGWFFPLLQ